MDVATDSNRVSFSLMARVMETNSELLLTVGYLFHSILCMLELSAAYLVAVLNYITCFENLTALNLCSQTESRSCRRDIPMEVLVTNLTARGPKAPGVYN